MNKRRGKEKYLLWTLVTLQGHPRGQERLTFFYIHLHFVTSIAYQYICYQILFHKYEEIQYINSPNDKSRL